MRLLFVLILMLVGMPAFAQIDAAAPLPAPAQPAPPPIKVRLDTSEGTIILALPKDKAPITVSNFLAYVDGKRLDGATFYRAMKYGEGGLIQGGTRGEPKRVLPPIVHESTAQTGLSHDDGAISMARNAPGTAAGDFFIIVGGMRGLDASPAGTGDNQGFAVFGHVVEGMDIVRRILAAPTSPTEGEGVMKGQMLSPTIKILTARRTPLND